MQKLQLSIPEPCHENWQHMTPTDQGRFCNACAKEVVDFSTMTDMQVLNYFSTGTHEKVCGRALPEQLDRTISRPTVAKKRLFRYWNYIVMFLMFFTKGNGVKAQGGVKPVTECSPVKTNDIRIRGQMLTTDDVKKETSRVITGKVTDIDGKPVPYATINIKGTASGVSADANGNYIIRINAHNILSITAASFKAVEVPVGSQSLINTVLENDSRMLLGEFYTSVSWSSSPGYSAMDKIKSVAILKVKDEESGKFLPNVSIVIIKNGSSDTVSTDKKGMYKIKGITTDTRCFIKVSADGYEGTEFTINENDFKDRKKEWEILLRKEKVEAVRPNTTAMAGTEKIIRMGGISTISPDKGPLYVVDGKIMPGTKDIKPDDIEDITLLQGSAAVAIFGPDGANGAIVVITRKSKEKCLKEVVIPSNGTNRVLGMVGVQGVQVKINEESPIETGTQIKIYPNPVRRGNTFNIALKLKQTGLYQIQITDAAGRVVLQKQINATTKDYSEKIPADSRWSSGVYSISLIDNRNQLINQTSFIFQ